MIYQKYYLDDPFIGSEKLLCAPPVPWLLCVYGINVETEVSFIATNKPQKASNITLDGNATHGTYLCRDGILFESKDTEQPILEREEPHEDPKFVVFSFFC